MNTDAFLKSAEREFLEPIEANIRGTVPNWISGSLFRNGPAKFEVGDDSYEHYFDGLAMVQKFEIREGKVSFRSQFLRSKTYKKNMASNRIVISEFGTMSYPDPCKNIFHRYFSHFFQREMTDNTLVNVFPMGDELYCATEVPLLNRIDPTTLDVKEHHDLRNYVSVFTATAHPHMDNDGTVHNIGMGKGKKGPAYLIVQLKPDEREKDSAAITTARQVASVQSRWTWSPGYMHSFGMSENYYIVIESALAINVLKMQALKICHVPMSKALTWHEDHPTLLHVVSKATGETQTFTADPFFTFHQGNAYEEDGHLVLDSSCYRTGNIIHQVQVAKLSETNVIGGDDPPIMKRFVLPLNADPKAGDQNLVTLQGTTASAHFKSDGSIHVMPEQLSDISMEFPSINYRGYNTKKYRFLYGLCFQTKFEKLVKIDLISRESKEWSEENGYPSEPVFVANPDGTEEDDGVILSAVVTFDQAGHRSQFLVILDAKSMQEIGRAVLPEVSVPKTFHGMFLPGWF